MKFGKRLRDQMEETFPEWRPNFLSYKYLKKRLKSMAAEGTEKRNEEAAPLCKKACFGARGLNPAVTEGLRFWNVLNEELRKCNSFFIEKEEEFVIRLQDLKDRIAHMKNVCGFADPDLSFMHAGDSLAHIRKTGVDLHGEMVLLNFYSSLNYTGLVKILKKHDKMTGTSMRDPFIHSVLRQPFQTTELLRRLTQECEQQLIQLIPPSPPVLAGVALPPADLAASAADAARPSADLAASMAASHASMSPKSSPVSPTSNSVPSDFTIVYRCTVAALKSLTDIHASSKTPHPLVQQQQQKGQQLQQQQQEQRSGLGLSFCPPPLVLTKHGGKGDDSDDDSDDEKAGKKLGEDK